MDAVKFALGDVVYMKIKPDDPGMVTAIVFRAHGVQYYITWGSGSELTHYDIELTKDKSFSEKVHE